LVIGCKDNKSYIDVSYIDVTFLKKVQERGVFLALVLLFSAFDMV
jgi:hypothetical protein